MKNKNVAKRVVLGLFVVGVATLIAACGGGQGGGTEGAPTKSPQAVSSSSSSTDMLTWTPGSVSYPANPGSVQELPIVVTTKRLLGRVAIDVAPELRGIVTVSPTSLASLRPDQSATVTMRFAPGASEALRTVSGSVRILLGTSTLAKPLPVSVTLVAPETLNGIIVPPEPPKALNDLTIAGIDQNKNGVRDDAERSLATAAGNLSEFQFAIAYARAYQRQITDPTPKTRSDALSLYGQIKCASQTQSRGVIGFDLRGTIVNTPERKTAYINFQDVLVGYVPEELPSCM